MKHAFIAAALLLTSTLAYAGSVPSNFEDPNNKYSQMGQAQKTCWKTHAAGGDTSEARAIQPESQAVPQNEFQKKARSVRAT